jgi:mannosyltransferase
LNPHDVLDGPLAEPDGPATPAKTTGPEGQPTPGSPWRARATWLVQRVWFWPLVVTFAAGVFKIGKPELWRDELRSWSAASRSLDQIFHMLGTTDAAVALYYLLLHYWMAIFGDSATAMRLLSAVAMAASAVLISLIGQRLFDRRTAILGGLIFAIIPAISRFAQEVRPYALTMLMATAATLLLLRLIEKPGWGRALAYGLAVTGLALTQVVALPLLFAHGVGVLLMRRERRMMVLWSVGVAVGLALASPIILLSSSQYGHQVGSLPEATIGELTKLPARLFASALIVGAIIVLCVLSVTRGWRPVTLLACWAVGPIAAIWVASNLGHSYWMSRYMLFTLPAFALLAGAAVAAMKTRMVIAVMVVLAMLGSQDQREIRWEGAHDQWTYPVYANTAVLYSDMADIIGQNLKPGDAIVFSQRDDYWLLDIGLAYHMRGQAQPRDVLVTETSVQRGDFWPVECTRPAECLAGVQRLWVVSIGLLTEDPLEYMEGDKAQAIRRDFVLEQKWYPSGLDIYLMQRA